MDIFRTIFFSIVVPIIWLSGFAYVISSSLLDWKNAWKKKSKKKLWLHTWILMVAIYFLIYGKSLQ